MSGPSVMPSPAAIGAGGLVLFAIGIACSMLGAGAIAEWLMRRRDARLVRELAGGLR